MSTVLGIDISPIIKDGIIYGYTFKYPSGKKLYMMFTKQRSLDDPQIPYPPHIRDDISPGEYYELVEQPDIYEHVYYKNYIGDNVIRDREYQKIKYSPKDRRTIAVLGTGVYTNGLLAMTDHLEKQEESSKIVSVSKHKLNLFFGKPKGIDLSKLQFTNISVYSVTPQDEAQTITDYLSVMNELKQDLSGNKIVITDATANIGGNTINFARNGMTVNAVEIDPLTCKVLENNVGVFKLSNVNIRCSNYLSVMNELKQDVIFFDPPWGGVGYKNSESLDLYLGSTNIVDIVREILSKKLASVIAIKLPNNYNFEGLNESIKSLNGNIKYKDILRKGRVSYVLALITRSG